MLFTPLQDKLNNESRPLVKFWVKWYNFAFGNPLIWYVVPHPSWILYIVVPDVLLSIIVNVPFGESDASEHVNPENAIHAPLYIMVVVDVEVDEDVVVLTVVVVVDVVVGKTEQNPPFG